MLTVKLCKLHDFLYTLREAYQQVAEIVLCAWAVDILSGTVRLSTPTTSEAPSSEIDACP